MLPKPRIHFIENLNNFRQLPNSQDWESGFWWRIGKATADALRGGHLYLHASQKTPSHQGGVILDYRIEHEGMYQGRYVFRFRPSSQHRGVLAEAGLWSYRYKQVVL